jgi:hypothetical protein
MRQSQVSRYARRGDIPTTRVRGELRFQLAHLHAWREEYERVVDEGIAQLVLERMADPANHVFIPLEEARAQLGL